MENYDRQGLLSLEQYLIIDDAWFLKSINNDKFLFKEIYQALVTDEIPKDIQHLTKLKTENDWYNIGELAHKIKGGAMYCGAIRMQQACQNLEDCINLLHIDDLQ